MPRKTYRIISNTFLVGLKSALNLLFFSFLSKYLGSRLFAVYNFYTAFFISFKGLLDSGTSQYILSQSENNIKWKYYTFILIPIIQFLSFLLIFSIYFLLVKNQNSTFIDAFIIVFLNFILQIYIGNFTNFFERFELTKIYTWLNFLGAVLQIFCLLIFINLFSPSILYLFSSICILWLILIIIFISVGFNKLKTIEFYHKNSKENIHNWNAYLIPLIFYGLVSALYSIIDRFFAFQTNDDISQNKMAIIIMFIGVVSVIVSVYLRDLTKSFSILSNRNALIKLKSAMYLSSIASILVLLISIPFTNFVVTIFFDKSYSLNLTEIISLCFYFSFYLSNQIIIGYYYARGMTKYISIVGVIGMILLFVLALYIYFVLSITSKYIVLLFILKLSLLQFYQLVYFINNCFDFNNYKNLVLEILISFVIMLLTVYIIYNFKYNILINFLLLAVSFTSLLLINKKLIKDQLKKYV